MKKGTYKTQRLNISSDGLKIWDNVLVRIPISVVRRMEYISNNISHLGNEYLMLLNGEFNNDDFTFTIDGEKFHLPEQEVTPSVCETDELWDNAEFNTAIHRHPHGVTSFSATDHMYLNTEVECSLVFIPPSQIPDATFSLRLEGGGAVKLDTIVEIIDDDTYGVTTEMLTRIKPKPVPRKLVRQSPVVSDHQNLWEGNMGNVWDRMERNIGRDNIVPQEHFPSVYGNLQEESSYDEEDLWDTIASPKP